jgi:hypothetical protein
VLAGTQPLLLAKSCQRRKEQILKKSCRTVFVGVGQGGTAWRSGNPHMHQAPQATSQAVADLAQGIGASELTEQHGDELRPAGKALGVTLSGVLLYECGELGSGKVLEQWIEEARDL